MAEPRKKPTDIDPYFPWQQKYSRYLNRESIVIGWLLLLTALATWFALRT